MAERKLRIEIRSGKQWKEVTFPVPQELEQHLLDLLKVEDAMTGSAFKTAGSKNIKVRITTFQFDKNL